MPLFMDIHFAGNNSVEDTLKTSINKGISSGHPLKSMHELQGHLQKKMSDM